MQLLGPGVRKMSLVLPDVLHEVMVFQTPSQKPLRVPVAAFPNTICSNILVSSSLIGGKLHLG